MNQNPYNPPPAFDGNEQSGQQQNPEPPAGPLIRTMAKDIETLGKKPPEGPAPFQSPAGYEPPPEMPLGMAPPPPPGEESTAGRPPVEIPAPPASPPFEIPKPEEQSPAYPMPPQIPEEPPMETPPPPSTAPIESTETVISEKTLAEFAPPQPPKKDIKKLALIAGIVGGAVIFGLAGWFLYPKIFPATAPTPVIPTPIPGTPVPTLEPPLTPIPTPTPTPISFFQKTPEKTEVLDIGIQNILTKSELINALEEERNKSETVGTLKIIDLRQEGGVVFFDQFANLIGLNIPAKLKGLIFPEFKLFVNSHAQEGSKIGLILFVSDPVEAAEQLSNWENTMSADLADLFLKSDRGEKNEFRDGNYREVNKRYISFKPPFSLDYGLYQNFLVIGTSRFNFANAIDHILGEE